MRSVVAMLVLVALSGCFGGEPSPTLASDPSVEASLSWSPTFPDAGQVVTFAASVRSTAPGDSISSMEWRFDGASFTESKPIHVFDSPGTYPVTLIVVTAELGASTFHNNITVTGRISPGTPVDEGEPAPPTPEPEPAAPGDPLKIFFAQNEATVSFSYTWSERAQLLAWDFGDGTSSKEASPTHRYNSVGDYTVTLRATSQETPTTSATVNIVIDGVPFEPHVIVAIPDSGANPYHEAFYRPQRTGHPCEYVEDFPCTLPALPLSVGQGLTYEQAVAKDTALWATVKPGTFYWIPQTAFVAFGCESVHDNKCGLDDGPQTHGTGTTGSVISEEPGVLLAFKEGGPDIIQFNSAKIPVDIFSVSWGWAVPGAGLSAPLPLCGDNAQLYVKSAGNEPGLTTLPDCWTSHPKVMSVGGAYAQDNTQYAASGKEPDFVSYYCRPAPHDSKVSGTSSWCGTSFSAPTAAGAMAKALLAVRQNSGHTGSIEGDQVDPIAGISVRDFRDALELTASYNPDARYSDTSLLGVPLNPVAPCLQWGWGFLDGGVADATIAHLLGTELGTKDAFCTTYMESLYAYRQAVNDRDGP